MLNLRAEYESSDLRPSAANQALARGVSAAQFHELKETLHTQLLQRIDMEVMAAMEPGKVRRELGVLLLQLLDQSGNALNTFERSRAVKEVQDEVLGLGPLEPLLADPTISDILVNGPKQVYVERRGKLELTDTVFADNGHLMRIIDKIVANVGRRVDESSPMVDARLDDGSRVNAIIPPLALDGAVLSIRRFAAVSLTMEDLIYNQSIPKPLAQLLGAMVRAKMNILISGGTGTGKTTLLNVLSAYIPHNERIVTIEDAAELQTQQPHVVRLETRPPNIEGKGEVNQRALVKNSLRMRPDRIILGEVRGAEVLDMLQAMNTGHEGSMATVHANSPRDALMRLESMAGHGGQAITQDALRKQVSSAINAVVQISRLNDGRRRIVSVQEITGMESEVVCMQEIYRFTQTGVGADGSVSGVFKATGIRPRFMDRIQSYGIELNDDVFDPSFTYE